MQLVLADTLISCVSSSSIFSPFLVRTLLGHRKWLKNGEKQIGEVVQSGMMLPVCLPLVEKSSQPFYVAICGI